jgi:hypothetical protein
MKNKKSIDPFIRFIILSIISCNCGCIVGLLIFKASTTPCKPIPDTVYVYKQHSDWELLKTAIIWQESKGNPKARNGDAVGILQITPIYVAEANRISKIDTFVLSDRESASESLKMFEIVQGFHNPEKDIKKAIKLHNPTAGYKYYQDVIDKFRMLKYQQYKD